MRTVVSVWVGACVLGVIAGAALGQATSGAMPGSPSAQVQRERDAAGNVVGPERAGWWNDSVFYEIFVRSFKDSASGPLAGDGVGDLAGIAEKLDYLNDGDPATTGDLGITGIWLTPIHPSPSYHGYDITDYERVRREYGSVEDLRRLVAECHKRGIKVMLDLVPNHCSSEHPWFKEALADTKSPRHNWFIWSETDPGWKGPWGERVWHRATVGGAGGTPAWYYGMFSSRMPDLNYREPAVSDAMLDVVRFWLDAKGGEGKGAGSGVGVDGYRLDAIRHLVEDGQVQENTPETHEWLRTFRKALKAARPDAVSIGEVWTSSEIASSYVGDQLDMAFEFDLSFAMVEAARTGKAKRIAEAQEKVLRCYPPNQYGRFLTNHDENRVMTELKGDAGAMRVAAAMLLLGPGVPFIYYGEEIGMTGAKPDELIRTPMQWTRGENAGFTSGKPWEAVNGGGAEVNVEKESADAGSLLSWYRTLIRVRQSEPALLHGGYKAVPTGNEGVYAFVRTGERPVLVVVNLSSAEVVDYRLAVPLAAEPGRAWRARGILPVRGEASPIEKPAPALAAGGAYVFEIGAAATRGEDAPGESGTPRGVH